MCLRESMATGGFVVRLAFQKGTDMEHWRDENWRGPVDVFGEEPILVPLSLPQIPQGLYWNQTQTFAVRNRRHKKQ